MTKVSKSVDHASSPDEMWSRIGDFHGADTWHPAVVSSTPLDDGKGRELGLPDGGKIRETKTAEGPHSYSYRIDESPLPVRDYESTIAVADGADGGCRVSWETEFEPEGATEAEAVAVIEGILEGLDSL